MLGDRKKEYEVHKEYIKEEGLDQLIDFEENLNYQQGVFDAIRTPSIPLPPQSGDLVALHKIIRKRKCFTVLEFGIGYSTIVIADALQKNQCDWEKLSPRPVVRNRFMFQLFSIDTSQHWLENIRKRIPPSLFERVHLQYSEVEIGTFCGQLCHYFKELPDIIPDFIYLDGPAPKDVKGTIHGLSFQCDERTVMAADLLLMEPTFLPGTFIAIDGRTNNARFLERNFTRNYDVIWNKEGDTTTFELKEERLGKYNVLGFDFF